MGTSWEEEDYGNLYRKKEDGVNLDGKKKIVGTCIGRTGLRESLKGELGCGNLFSVCL